MWVVYSGQVRGEVGMRSRMWCVGWAVWVHGFCYYMLLYAILAEPMYPHHPSYITHARSHTHFSSYLPTVYNPHKSSVAAY